MAKRFDKRYYDYLNTIRWPDKYEMHTRLGKMKTHFTVACYCSLEGPGQHVQYVNGQRWLQLLMCKQFNSMKLAENSRSYQRLYAPFDWPGHVVVLFPRGMRLPQYICDIEVGYSGG